MSTAANVAVGSATVATGGVFGAPAATALPATADAVLNVAFKNLGFVSEDGVVQTIDQTTEDIRAWQGRALVRKILTEEDVTYQFTLLETSPETLKAYYNDYDVETAAVVLKGQEGLRQRWVIEVEDGEDHIRIVIPDGQVTERGDVTYASTEAIGYPITVTAYPDASGVKATILFETAGAAPDEG